MQSAERGALSPASPEATPARIQAGRRSSAKRARGRGQTPGGRPLSGQILEGIARTPISETEGWRGLNARRLATFTGSVRNGPEADSPKFVGYVPPIDGHEFSRSLDNLEVHGSAETVDATVSGSWGEKHAPSVSRGRVLGKVDPDGLDPPEYGFHPGPVGFDPINEGWILQLAEVMGPYQCSDVPSVGIALGKCILKLVS